MDRRVRTPIRAALLAAIGAAGLLLAACSNVNLVQLLTTEVMRATNKFLVVNAVGPTAPTNVNPGAPIVIEFDRPLSTTSVDSTSIVIAPSDLFVPTFMLSNGNKTLSVEADPYLKDNTTYEVRLTLALRAEDGSTLEQERTWSFGTGVYPAGSLKVTDGGGTEVTYTRFLQPHFTITYKAICDKYRVSTDPAAFGSFTDPDAGWRPLSGPSPWTFPSSDLESPTFSLSSGDGQKTVYIQFLRTVTGDRSLVRSDVVVLDQTLPGVPAISPSTIYINGYSPTGTTATVTVTDASGISSYNWSYSAPVTVSSTTVSNPTIGAGVADGGPYSLSLTVTDGAGNISASSASASVIRDTVAPNAPFFDATNTPLYMIATRPFYDWAPSGGGSGNYRLTIEGFKPATTSSTYLTFKEDLKDGVYFAHIEERDLAGNWSSPDALNRDDWTTVIAPMVPPHRFEGVPLVPPKNFHILEWRPVERALSYRLYLRLAGGVFPKGGTLITTSYYDPTLAAGTKYEWFVEAYGDTLGTKYIAALPASSYFGFMTGK
jgi:hypothetical protein